MLRPGLVTSEKLQSPSKKCTFPGDNREAAEVLTANGSTYSAHNFALHESKARNWKEMDLSNHGD